MRLRMETVKRLRKLGAQKNSAKKDGSAGPDAAHGDKSKLADAMTSRPSSSIVTREPRVKKNTLSSAPAPRAKYRKRQIHKTWLPTHIYHAKRAHMTPPREPLWRFAVPMAPSIKSYRPTHRASNDRGAIAWDMSYMSTIGLEGDERSLQGLLKALYVGGPSDSSAPWSPKGRRWRQGTRVWQGWLYERDCYPLRPIAPTTVVWRYQIADGEIATLADRTGSSVEIPTNTLYSRRQVIIRVHPSAFLQLWQQVISLAKVQKPQVTVEDLRFEIGSIEVTGPGSTEALIGALWPTTKDSLENAKNSIEATWQTLGGVSNPAVLPTNALLHFDIVDPRLHFPPRTTKTQSHQRHEDLLEVLASWPYDSPQTCPGLFERNKRLAASRALSSQKSINRRKSLAKPGSYPEALPQDPHIPVMLYPSAERHASENAPGRSHSSRQAKWVVLLPWKAVPAVWQSIMYYPLSTGGQVRLGALQQQQQIAFESGIPWFPGDFPGTTAGDSWQRLEDHKRKEEWARRPKGKRVQWDSITLGPDRKGEIGDGSICDWGVFTTKNHLANGSDTENGFCAKNTPYHISSSLAQSLLSGSPPTNFTLEPSRIALVTVRIVYLTRGSPLPCARIYRLPSLSSPSSSTTTRQELSLRAQWLAQDPAHAKPVKKTAKSNEKRDLLAAKLRGASSRRETKQALTADLLQPSLSSSTKAADLEMGTGTRGKDGDVYPAVPGEEDLIGFATSGEYCLTEGKGVAIGSLVMERLLEGTDRGDSDDAAAAQAADGKVAANRRREDRMCVVRNAGETVGRLAIWEIV